MATQTDLAEKLSPESQAWHLADLLKTNSSSITNIKIVLFSNAISTMQKPINVEELEGVKVVKNVFDLKRYIANSKDNSGSEPIEINVTDFNCGTISCLKTHSETADYQSYLCVIPGTLLAEIFSTYRAKLLEQNVRVFLQARTKVNKGIIETIHETPERFFAYNNGLTVTASDISFLDETETSIKYIQNLQIVNGGQTTASILYARDMKKSDLSKVSVQMKLSVIKDELLDEVVPKISRYSNTQNAVSDADFFSNHPFHGLLEDKANTTKYPTLPGNLYSEKWFYERARGTYADKTAYATPAQRDAFYRQFPKHKKFVKTDVAKYQLSIDQKPWLVSKGANSVFMEFSKIISKDWKKNKSQFNDLYFKKLICNMIIYRYLDKHIQKTDWYKEKTGWKAQIVNYSVAFLMNWLESRKLTLNVEIIWKNQEIPEKLLMFLDKIAQHIKDHVNNPPANLSNPGEYCKRQVCWDDLIQKGISFLEGFKPQTDSFAKNIKEAESGERDAKRQEQEDETLRLEIRIVDFTPHCVEIRERATRRGILNQHSSEAITRISRQNYNLTFAQKSALRDLLNTLEISLRPQDPVF